MLDGETAIRRFFFFQAEDGIRDVAVTGVQTCALPICLPEARAWRMAGRLPRGRSTPPPRHRRTGGRHPRRRDTLDRKSTRLNSSHGYISYAVFCLKKKKQLYTAILRITAHLHTTPSAL